MRAKLSEHSLPVHAASCGTHHSVLSKILVLFQLDELQKKHHEVNLAVAAAEGNTCGNQHEIPLSKQKREPSTGLAKKFVRIFL